MRIKKQYFVLIYVIFVPLLTCCNSGKEIKINDEEIVLNIEKKELNNIKNVIYPIEEKIDIDNMQDGIYNVSFGKQDIEIIDNRTYILFNIYTMDEYDYEMIQNINIGDYIKRGEFVEEIINIVWDDKHECVTFDECEDISDACNVYMPSNNGYFRMGQSESYDWYSTGSYAIELSDGCILRDCSDLKHCVEIIGIENIIQYIDDVSIMFDERSTTIEVKNKQVIKIERIWTT